MYEKNISEERKKYLRQINRSKVLIVLTRLAIVILFIAVWEILANVGIIDSFIASSPSRIWNTFLNLSSSDLMTHVGITCLETLIGFTCLFNYVLPNLNPKPLSNNMLILNSFIIQTDGEHKKGTAE